MSFLDRAKQAAEQARQAAEQAAERTSSALRDPTTTERARARLRIARRGIVTALERIDPSVLADVIVKATILQERANAALRDTRSPYRISEIAIGASIPPSVTFSITRSDDSPDAAHATDAAAASLPDATTITALDGTQLDEADLVALAGDPDG
jgi:hypothetical protein